MDKTADYQRRIHAATNLVALNLGKSHSIEELAAVSNFSKFHFHRIYSALSGETVANMVNRLRLEGAAGTLIYNKNLSVTRVAVDHGYSSGANFTKAFTQHFGCSPSAYRANSKIGKAIAINPLEDSNIELEVKLKHQPETQLAYYRRKGPYVHLEISAMHQKIQQWAEDRGCAAEPPASIGIAWSDSLITKEENWIYDACVAVKPATRGDGAFSIASLQGGLVAQLEVELAANESHDLSPYWDWLVRDWFMASNYELRSSPSYERYINTVNGLKVRYAEGLTGLSDFSHAVVLWWASESDSNKERDQLVYRKPYAKNPDDVGVFGSRSPSRPNPIGLSVIALQHVDTTNATITTPYIDTEPGTPIIDIKPYFPASDRVKNVVMPSWCGHWPAYYEESADFDWASEFE